MEPRPVRQLARALGAHISAARSDALLVATVVFMFVAGSCRSDGAGGGGRGFSIEDGEWRLTSLRGSPVEPAPAGTRAPQFRLASEGRHASGFTGVNDFNSSYQLDGDSLHFGPLALTRRAGLPPLARLESSFVDALHETAAWRRNGQDIELLDVAGQPLARFTRAASSIPSAP